MRVLCFLARRRTWGFRVPQCGDGLYVFLSTHQRCCDRRFLAAGTCCPLPHHMCGVFDRFLKDSEFIGSHSMQPPVVNHRDGFDFWYLLISKPSIHQVNMQLRHATEADKTGGDSIESFRRFTTRLPLTKESFRHGRQSWLGTLHTRSGTAIFPIMVKDRLPHDFVE